MEAATLLSRLSSAGLTVRRSGDKLIVTPKDRLTDELRNAIRDAKTKLLSALTVHQDVCAQPTTSNQDLEQRILIMARRWGYSAEELAEALTGAKSDPHGWLVWTERDELDFGACVTREDFVQAYVRIRGLA